MIESQRRHDTKSFNLFQDAPTIDLETREGLESLISKHSKAIKNSEGEVCIPYAIIRGNVTPLGKDLVSQAGEEGGSADLPRGVIRTFTLTEHKRTLSRSGFWYDSERKIHEHSTDVPFCLVPQSIKLPSKGVEVTEWDQAAKVHMDTTKDVFDASPSGLGDHIWGWVVGDRQKGLQSEEKMLLSGTGITAIGEVVVKKGTTSGQPSVRIQPPSDGKNAYYLVKESAKSFVKDMEAGNRVLKYFILAFGSVGLAVAAWATYKYYKKYVQLQRALGNQRTLDQILEDRQSRPSPTVEENGEDSGPGRNCVICMTQTREVIFLECGHVCACVGCAIEVMNRDPMCPVCRGQITRVAPAYIV